MTLRKKGGVGILSFSCLTLTSQVSCTSWTVLMVWLSSAFLGQACFSTGTRAEKAGTAVCVSLSTCFFGLVHSVTKVVRWGPLCLLSISFFSMVSFTSLGRHISPHFITRRTISRICDVEKTQGPTCARQGLSLSYETPEPESRLNLLCSPLRWPYVLQFSCLGLLNSFDCCPSSPDRTGTHLLGDSDLYPKTLSKWPCLFLFLKSWSHEAWPPVTLWCHTISNLF